MTQQTLVSPGIDRSVTLDCVGDWGQANFHRILSWLSQEFCDRAGSRSRVRISSVLGAGLEALWEVSDGEMDLCIVTPHALMDKALTGEDFFAGRAPMPQLRALAVLPQVDRLVFAVAPKFKVSSFEDLRTQKPALRIASSRNDEGNFIGYTADRFMEAHGISEQVLNSWGGEYVRAHRPDQCLQLVRDGLADAVVQEAIMTPWWRDLIEDGSLRPISAEMQALDALGKKLHLAAATIPAGYWKGQDQPIHALDFSDFVLVARADMPDDVAYLLAWCLVETRDKIERQYKHILPEQSPLSYPLNPIAMAKSVLPLHPGARRYYQEAGHLK